MTSNVITIGSTTVIHNGSNMRIYKPKLDPSQRDSSENSFIDTFYNKLTEERCKLTLIGGYLLTCLLENSKIYFQMNILEKDEINIYFNDEVEVETYLFSDEDNNAEKYLTKFFYNKRWSSK